MASDPDVRCQQRFQNFDRALTLLRAAVAEGPGKLNQLEKEGVVQRFEYTLELAWKTAKDYLEHSGLLISPVTPRQVLKEAVAANIIADGQVWIDMLNHRNLLSHTYDLAVFEQAVQAVVDRYLAALGAFHTFLEAEIAK